MSEDHKKGVSLESVQHFAAGTAGGFAGKVLEYPFDTVKVLLQTQDPFKPSYKGAVDCLIKTYKHVGFFGLYKGLASPLAGASAEVATLFTSYGWIKILLGEENHELSLLELSLAGAGSGVFVAHVLTPVELIKCRLQVQQSTGAVKAAYSSPLDVIRKTIRNDGIKGLYQGHVGTLAREIPGNFAWFGAYETGCYLLTPAGKKKEDLPLWANMIAGAGAGVSYWSAFFPADAVKSQIQTDPAFAKSSFVDVFKHIWRTKGIPGLYAGWAVTCIRAAPSHALVFVVYELMMKLFDRA
eukprot:c10360_g1_i1.p1 GENE.c10360_g1_i1~~c10360_g1_i1.p1  ORF type:complete len:297 (+),score=134.05 c10360_g1_i1:37-927(+)